VKLSGQLVVGLGVRCRLDGWPFCPRCDEDELWSPASISLAGKPLADWLLLELRCYRCRLTVPGGTFVIARA
jgi:hypothetical protein